MKRVLLSLVLGIGLSVASPAHAAEPVRLIAAGSLTEALTEMARSFEDDTGIRVATRFGPSGLMADAIRAGEPAEVFASADLGHPEALFRERRAASPIVFARNETCAYARPGLDVDTASLVHRMLDDKVKLGTSTPGADPSGDYAWAIFRKVEALRPGAFDRLSRKALQLVGGPTSQPTPRGESPVGYLLGKGEADLFLGYCSGAAAIARSHPDIRAVRLPAALAIGADYGLAVLEGARPEAARFALYMLSTKGQLILKKHGFSAPTLPREP